jgi:DNA-binding NarL/FixJ family response regulator
MTLNRNTPKNPPLTIRAHCNRECIMETSSNATVLIVDDEYVMTLHSEKLLEKNGYDVVGIADSGEQAVDLAEETRPDIVIMDIKLPGKFDGITAAESILKQTGISCIFLSGYDDQELVERAKKVRPLAFLLKPIIERQVLVELEVALYRVNKEKERQLFSKEDFPDELPARYADLTPSEIRIVSFVRKGKTTKEISAELDLSDHTVMWHRKNIRKKLNLLNKKENLVTHLLQ